jgi:hypothetical protein
MTAHYGHRGTFASNALGAIDLPILTLEDSLGATPLPAPRPEPAFEEKSDNS